MALDATIRLIEALTKLVGVMAWPALAALVLIRLRPDLRKLVDNYSEFTFKGGGFEASVKRQQAQAAAALTAAAVARPETGNNAEAAAKEASAAADIVLEVATPRAMRRAAGATVLWVDDRPSNNFHERQALEALGVRFVLALSTEEALDSLDKRPVDAIISDMGRPPDNQAGYTLLDKLRASGNSTPFIIYAGSKSPEHQSEARKRGAVGCTNRPDELFEMVLSVLGRAA